MRPGTQFPFVSAEKSFWHPSSSDPTISQNLEKYLIVSKNMKKSCMLSMMYTMSMQNMLYYELHKNDKSWNIETIHCSLYSDLYIFHFWVA